MFTEKQKRMLMLSTLKKKLCSKEAPYNNLEMSNVLIINNKCNITLLVNTKSDLDELNIHVMHLAKLLAPKYITINLYITKEEAKYFAKCEEVQYA